MRSKATAGVLRRPVSAGWRSTPRWGMLALLAACGFLVRFWGITKLHFWDENVYLLNAEYFYSGHAGYIGIDSRPPLLSLLFAAVFHVWHSDYAAEVVAGILNALGPLFLFLAGCRIVGKNAAAIAALLLAFLPFFAGACTDETGTLITNCNGHSLLTDCPALTLILAALWLGVRALEEQTGLHFAAFGFMMAMAVLMRFGSLSSAPFLLLLVLAAKQRGRAAAATICGLLLGMGPYLCWSRARYGAFFFTLRQGWRNVNGDPQPWDYFAVHLPPMFSWLGITGLALWFITRAVELVRWKRSSAKDGGAGAPSTLRWEIFLWIWAVGVFLFFSNLRHKELRYGIPLAAPLLLLAGAGLGSLLQSQRKQLRVVGGGLLAAAMIVAFWPTLHRLRSGFVDSSVSDEMLIARSMRETLPPDTVLHANANYPDFAYYSGMTVNPLPETGNALYAALDRLPAGDVLIAYKAADEGGSPPEPPISYLDSNPRFTRLREFPTVVLYRVNPLPGR